MCELIAFVVHLRIVIFTFADNSGRVLRVPLSRQPMVHQRPTDTVVAQARALRSAQVYTVRQSEGKY